MATSGTYSYGETTDTIIKRALRICGIISNGETPTQAVYTDSLQALNAMTKAWIADGMQLWCIKTVQLASPTLVAGTPSYQIGVGATINQPAFMKMINCYKTFLTDGTDTPMVPITRNFYENLSAKLEQGEPNQWWYDPPGNLGTGNEVGTIYLFNCPSTFFVSNYRINMVGQVPLQDFTNTTDVMDFPDYYANAVTWGLAAQLVYESSLPISMIDRILAQAKAEKDMALGFGTEEGSIFFQPNQFWLAEGSKEQGIL